MDLITALTAAGGASAGGAGGYQISRSLRFNSADSAYLSRTPASAGNRKTWTWSGWVKRSAIGSTTTLFSAYIGSGTTDNDYFQIIYLNDALRISGYTTTYRLTSALYRDASAWYHVVVAVDTTNATVGDRIKLWVNGVIVSSFSETNNPSLNADLGINQAASHNIGRQSGFTNYFSGYLADINFVDGQALTADDFGETDATTGVWVPKAYAGTYGTNGFHLDFSDNTSTTTLGYDAAGSNDWTLNNFSVTAGAGNDSLVDTPTPYGTDTGAGGEVRGNYPTINPTFQAISNNSGTLSNGNLQIVGTSLTYFGFYAGTFAISSDTSQGYYFEYTQSTYANDGSHVGFYNVANFAVGMNPANSFMGGATTNTHGIGYTDFGYLGNLGSVTTGLTTWKTNGDVVGVAIKDNKVWFSKNGAWISGDPAAGTSPSATFPSARMVYPVAGTILNNVNHLNFGQRPFAYTAPSGFKALCTTNLPDPTVVQGDDYFNTVLYTGTGSSLGVTGVGFQPDFVWIKERSGAADHGLYDAVRGVQQQLESNTTTDETTEANGLTAFGTDGFTVGSLAQLNTNNDTYVAWNWKESTTSKFDIVTYTGNGTARTISHNLGVVPNMIIVKARTTASTDQGWPVYHSANTSNPETDYLLLNTNAATADLNTIWNDTAPTSTVFSVGTNALVNANNDTYVAYCFAEVPGYSAFGKYTGNGSADGPFVYTGFRPAWVMLKQTNTSGEHWYMQDAARNTYNPSGKRIKANSSDAELDSSSFYIDFLSNGMKLRNTNAGHNASGGTYIYAAFAENPFKYSLAR